MKERRKEGEEVIRKDVEGVSIFFTSTKGFMCIHLLLFIIINYY